MALTTPSSDAPGNNKPHNDMKRLLTTIIIALATLAAPPHPRLG